MNKRFLLTLATTCGLLLQNAWAVKPKVDAAAKALAALLTPLGLTPKSPAADGLAKARDQMVKILEAMEGSEFNGGSGGDDLLNMAYRYRPEIGPVERSTSIATISAAHKAARSMGLFNDEHKFLGRITKGSGSGQTAIFEYIVPMSINPVFSQSLVNLRIAAPANARVTPTDVTTRDQAYVTTLESVSREVTSLKKAAALKNAAEAKKQADIREDRERNFLGQTPAQAKKIWQADMDRDGEKALLLPSINLKGSVTGTPSKTTGGAWLVQAQVTNQSKTATEVEVECTVVGAFPRNREHFILLEAKQKLQMRASQVDKVNFKTLSEGSYAGQFDAYRKSHPLPTPKVAPGKGQPKPPKDEIIYLGTVFRVRHAKGIAATLVTHDGLKSFIEEESKTPLSSLPKLYAEAAKQ